MICSKLSLAGLLHKNQQDNTLKYSTVQDTSVLLLWLGVGMAHEKIMIFGCVWSLAKLLKVAFFFRSSLSKVIFFFPVQPIMTLNIYFIYIRCKEYKFYF